MYWEASRAAATVGVSAPIARCLSPAAFAAVRTELTTRVAGLAFTERLRGESDAARNERRRKRAQFSHTIVLVRLLERGCAVDPAQRMTSNDALATLTSLCEWYAPNSSACTCR
jgi:hypothetical protein